MRFHFAVWLFLLLAVGCATHRSKDIVLSYADDPKYIGGGTSLYLYNDGKWERWSYPLFGDGGRIIEKGLYERIGKQRIHFTGSDDFTDLYVYSPNGSSYLLNQKELKTARSTPARLNLYEGYTFYDTRAKMPPKPSRLIWDKMKKGQ